ncbi:MAG TPA: TMEM175 family protein [Terriglobales bacterium]|jgi:uncharacterized membrane protein|nr:TMEM175 family protein [Terriglobales bacterium]
MSKGRLEAFSDGVFAIVITLLILDVRLPAGVHVSIAALEQLLPRIATFVLSFVVVGVYWVAHHNMLYFIERVDRSLLWLNLLLLLCIVFIPFPASFLGTDLRSPLAVRLYGVSLIATNAAGTLFWSYATLGSRLAKPEVSREFAWRVVGIHSAPIAVYTLAVVVAAAALELSLALFAAVPLFFIVPNRWLRKAIGA